jgi:hypothetical protein
MLKMTDERYFELMRDYSLSLTQDELAAGYWFCHFEWDGMVVHKDEAEGQICMKKCDCRPKEDA